MRRLFNIFAFNGAAPHSCHSVLRRYCLVACTNNAYEGRADSQSYAAIVSKAPLVPGMTEQIFIDDEDVAVLDDFASNQAEL